MRSACARFFRSVTDWHRWLAASGEYRTTGRAVTGACNLAFLVLVVTGAYLWLPKAWTRLQLRNITWFRRGLPGKARDFNWHNTIGFWSFAPLFVVVLSATVISYPWASNLVYRAVGEQPPATAPGREGATAGRPARRSGRPVRRASAAESRRADRPRGLDLHLARAEQHVPDWRTISLRVPTSDKAPLVFTIDQGSGGQPQKRGTLTLDRVTGDGREVGDLREQQPRPPCADRSCASPTPAKCSAFQDRPSPASPRPVAWCWSTRASRCRCAASSPGAAAAMPSTSGRPRLRDQPTTPTPLRPLQPVSHHEAHQVP